VLWDIRGHWQDRRRDWYTGVHTDSETPRDKVSLSELYTQWIIELTCVLFRWTFIIAAICGILGALLTYLFVPDMTGVDLVDEDASFVEYLERNGWEGIVGEDEDTNVIGR
jgi:hypothetical protein